MSVKNAEQRSDDRSARDRCSRLLQFAASGQEPAERRRKPLPRFAVLDVTHHFGDAEEPRGEHRKAAAAVEEWHAQGHLLDARLNVGADRRQRQTENIMVMAFNTEPRARTKFRPPEDKAKSADRAAGCGYQQRRHRTCKEGAGRRDAMAARPCRAI